MINIRNNFYLKFSILTHLTHFISEHKKHLGFGALRKTTSERLLEIEDCRQQDKEDYTLHDCAISAFAMMFFQDPPMLKFQRRMQESTNRNNLKAMFNVEAIPKDTPLRDVLDQCPTFKLDKVFADFFIIFKEPSNWRLTVS